MKFLSNQTVSKKIDGHLLFLQPYNEGRKNIAIARFHSHLSKTEKLSHLFIGMTLLIPLINTFALLILRYLEKENEKKTANNQLGNSEISIEIYAPKPLLFLTNFRHSVLCAKEITKLFLKSLQLELIEGNPSKEFLIKNSNNGLILHYQNQQIEIQDILESIEWGSLENDFDLDNEKINCYLMQSKVFEALPNSENVSKNQIHLLNFIHLLGSILG